MDKILYSGHGYRVKENPVGVITKYCKKCKAELEFYYYCDALKCPHCSQPFHKKLRKKCFGITAPRLDQIRIVEGGNHQEGRR